MYKVLIYCVELHRQMTTGQTVEERGKSAMKEVKVYWTINEFAVREHGCVLLSIQDAHKIYEI